MALVAFPHSEPNSNPFQVYRLPQDCYIDALRWLPQLSAFHRRILLATFDSDTSSSSLQTLTYTPSPPNSNPHSESTPPPPELSLQSSYQTTSRVTSVKTFLTPQSQKPIIAASTLSGSLLVLTADSLNGSLDFGFSVSGKGFHRGTISGIDLGENGSDSVVSVGEDGRINFVGLGNGSNGSYQRVFDSNGLVSYSAVKWASPVEFVTGGLGFSLQWWDQRRPGGPVSQYKGNWSAGSTSRIIHSIDIHSSRKHTCLAGGSLGMVFAWDIRWQNQPIILSGAGTAANSAYTPCESEVWEVQFDNYSHSSNIHNLSSSRVLPAMICSEDGILAVVEQNEAPMELLAEPCAINSFDIDRQNPTDVLCGLEWESIAILVRS
ncbi:OLC1v1035267C1 [Oldenlandia corymbosa var. corymbosa]|uniref:OLC1v1035267C1 n=1 Tax=Oldenlandia corymbosa var. corymbosa TaxID=529605 RepID=A0AAV1CSN1_OLDCO|nr:OLC1v1035267C1 [Oldenlandia corymbosa var. corymbosa]